MTNVNKIRNADTLLAMQAEMNAMTAGEMGGCNGCGDCDCGERVTEPQDLGALAELIFGRSEALNKMQVAMDQLGTPEQAVLDDAESAFNEPEQRDSVAEMIEQNQRIRDIERVKTALFDAVCVTGTFTFRPIITKRVSRERMEKLIDEMVEGLKSKGLELSIDRVQAVSLPA